MVLWEITLGTAYFLGLKRTYRLALRIQRRLIGRKHPRLSAFAHRRTRAVFNVALMVHQNIQQRDIEVGRSLGNWILRWLDRMKPSAQIRPSAPKSSSHTGTLTSSTSKQVTNSYPKSSGSFQRYGAGSDRHLFSSPTNMWLKPLPTIAMMMRPARPSASIFQYRQLWSSGVEIPTLNCRGGRFEGVMRRDIMEWMLRN